MHRRTVNYGSHVLEYRLRFSNRKTLEIAVHPDQSIEAVAPKGTPPENIDPILHRSARWIMRQRRYFEQFTPRTPPRRYISGETHLYLGRQYRLKIINSKQTGIKLKAGRIMLMTPCPADTNQNRNLLTAWHKQRASVKYPERLQQIYPAFRRYGVTLPKLAIRPLTRRWGSMSANGRMTLNLDLIRAPTACIDYVIAHELCHLVHHHHNAAFFELLEHVMPDWKKRKEKLEHALA